jgi:hypothetical protein
MNQTRTAMNTEAYIGLENTYGAHNYHPLDVVVERAEGVWVYDVDGKRYLDCLAAYSAVNQGHCHPKILEAMLAQAQRVTLTSRAFRNDQLPLLCKELHDLTGMDMALPMNSGAEAVETALKMARKWGYKVKGIADGRAGIIVCANNFHGRTISIISFSTDEQYRDGFGPFTPGFTIIPYGDAKALEAAITPNTCAFLVEPIQGESGIVIPPKGFLKQAADLCRKNNVLLMTDEIQSGLGRTGKLFCHQWEGARRRLLPGVRRTVLEGNSRRVPPGRSRQHVRRQPARVRDRARVAAGAGRGEHGRALGRNGRLFPRQAAHAEERRREGSAGARPVDWRGAQIGGASLLRGPEGGGHLVQGNARARDSLRPAARHHARRHRLGVRTDSKGAPAAIRAPQRGLPRWGPRRQGRSTKRGIHGPHQNDHHGGGGTRLS